MNTENMFYLSRHAVIALAVAAAFPTVADAAAGRVEFAIGDATAVAADGAARQLNKGADINSGDTIKTAADGRVQVRFSDGGYMSLQPNTEFRIENYSFDGQQDGSERGFFRLVEGGLRAITGLVGRQHRPAYRVATPVATIGIRGSEFATTYAANDGRLKVRVIGGSIYVENENGNLILFKGQGAEVGAGQAPGYSEEMSGVQARGPEGGEPQRGDNQHREQQQLANIFTVNEQYTEDGISCALNDTCAGGSAVNQVIAQYAAQNAEGYYNLQSGGSISGANFGGTFVEGNLIASFGSYMVSGDFQVVGDSAHSDVTLNGYFGGDITQAGGLVVTGSASSETYGSFCSASCSLSGLGMFSGSAAETATINFNIHDEALGSASGSAVYQADSIVTDVDGL